jgi:O-antigen ligase
VADGSHRARLVLALPFLAAAVALPPERLFLAWLFAAPLVQGASSGQHHGHDVYRLVFLVPPLILVVRSVTGWFDARRPWLVDALPAAYFGYILVRVFLLPTSLTSPDHSSLRSLYIELGIPIIAYYAVAFGRVSARFPQHLAAAFLWSGVIVGVLAVIDGATHWNVWHTVVTGGDHVYRATSTIGSPAALGTYLGVAVAVAVAILSWDGPQTLRRPSLILIIVAVPASYVTYTRGPVLATAIVAAMIALAAGRVRWRTVFLLAALGVAIFAAWGHLTSTAIYKDRFGVTRTVTPRVVMTDVAVKLFEKRPAFGWGYSTFDQAKFLVPTTQPVVVQTTTSHDTFLTVLSELGVTGLALLVLPWLVLPWRAVVAASRRIVEPWIVAACVGSIVVYVIGAFTYDTRFFSFVIALPWIAAGLLRKQLATP